MNEWRHWLAQANLSQPEERTPAPAPTVHWRHLCSSGNARLIPGRDPFPWESWLGNARGLEQLANVTSFCICFWDDVPFFIGSVDRETRFILEVDEKGAGGRVRIWWDDGSEDFAMRWGS